MNTATIEAALTDKRWGAWINFLDTLNTKEELAEVRNYITTNHPDRLDKGIFDFIEERLVRWPNPELTPEFRAKFPLVSARLDSPQKIRIFLRGVEFRSGYDGVNVDVMGEVFENILQRHEVEGQQKVVYRQ